MDNLKYQKTGEIYNCFELTDQIDQHSYINNCNLYNACDSTPEGLKKKEELLHQNFASCGEGTYIEAPYYANWGGKNVHLGKNVYVNFHCTFVDDSDIYIGDYTMIAPNVTLDAATHPISPKLRLAGLEYNKAIHIGKNVWIGAGVIVLPGITIGDNSVIGAGSVVTKDIPANVIAFGNPCKVHRPISEDDDIHYDHGKEIRKEIRDLYLS